MSLRTTSMTGSQQSRWPNSRALKPGVDQYKELVAASVKGLPDRKHEDGNLAALGVMQYHYQATKTKNQILKRKSLELQEQVGEVSQEDFADMRAAMNPKSAQTTRRSARAL